MSSTLKRMPAGLYSHGAPPPPEYKSAYSGGWIDVPWKAIEPSKGAFSPIAIQRATAAFVNQGYRDVRLRVLMGAGSPDWAFAEFGTVEVKDPFQTVFHRVIPWWNPAYMLRYDVLCKWLNTIVGPDPAIIEVSASACMTVFAECFQRNIGDKQSRANLIAAGYTFDRDHTAMGAMMAVHAQRFGRTRTGLACNPWGDPETGTTNLAATMNLVDYGRTLMGNKLVIENNSLDAPAYNSDNYNTMYGMIGARGKPIGFQTAANDRLHDPAGMIDFACSLGATAIETEVRPPFTAPDAFLFAEQLKSNVRNNR